MRSFIFTKMKTFFSYWQRRIGKLKIKYSFLIGIKYEYKLYIITVIYFPLKKNNISFLSFCLF